MLHGLRNASNCPRRRARLVGHQPRGDCRESQASKPWSEASAPSNEAEVLPVFGSPQAPRPPAWSGQSAACPTTTVEIQRFKGWAALQVLSGRQTHGRRSVQVLYFVGKIRHSPSSMIAHVSPPSHNFRRFLGISFGLLQYWFFTNQTVLGGSIPFSC